MSNPFALLANNNNTNNNSNNNSGFNENNNIANDDSYNRTYMQPLNLTSAVLEFLLQNKKIILKKDDNDENVISFTDDIPALVKVQQEKKKYDKLKKTRKTFKKSTKTAKYNQPGLAIRLREESSVYNSEKDRYKIRFSTRKNPRNLKISEKKIQEYEMIVEAPYIKLIKHLIPLFISFDNGEYSISNEVQVPEGFTFVEPFDSSKTLKNSSFIYDRKDNGEWNLQLQKGSLHTFFKVDGKDYLLFGYPNQQDLLMGIHLDDELNEGINDVLANQSRERLERTVSLWNYLHSTDESKQIKSDKDLWKMTGLLMDYAKELGQLKYIYDDKKILENFLDDIRNVGNGFVKELLSRGETTINYTFHILEINRKNDSDKVSVNLPFNRIKEIKEEHKSLLKKVQELIVSLMFNQTFINFSSNKSDNSVNLDNLLIYCRNTGYFHLNVDYIDPFSSNEIYFNQLINVIQIEDLINGVGNWEKVDIFSFQSRKKLNPVLQTHTRQQKGGNVLSSIELSSFFEKSTYEVLLFSSKKNRNFKELEMAFILLNQKL